MTRTMNFNITSDKRKEFAQTVAEYFHGEAKYTMPGFRYVINDKATIMKDGTLVIKDEAEGDVPYLLDYLGTNGFKLDEEEETEETVMVEEESAADDDEPAEEIDDEEVAEEEPEGDEEEPMVLQISIPDNLTDDEFERLDAVIWSKEEIIRKSLGTEGLTVKREDGKIIFDGFPAIDSEHHHAYAQFVTSLVEFAKNARHVNRVQTTVENEKYYFRIFLIRLGMNGSEFKQTRKILLENLSGNAAFKTDAQLKAHSAKWQEKRKAAKAAKVVEAEQAPPEAETSESEDIGEETDDDENAE